MLSCRSLQSIVYAVLSDNAAASISNSCSSSSSSRSSDASTHLSASLSPHLSLSLSSCACVCAWRQWNSDSGSPATIYDEIGINKQHEMKTDTTSCAEIHPHIDLRHFLRHHTIWTTLSVCLPSSVSVKLLSDRLILRTYDGLSVTSRRCVVTIFSAR